MNKDLSSLYAERRSIYNLGNRQILPETEISKLIADALKFCPSAFNSQSARVVVLYGDYYRKLWDIVLTELSKVRQNAGHNRKNQNLYRRPRNRPLF